MPRVKTSKVFLPAPGQIMRHPHLKKLRRDVIDAIRESTNVAVDAMRDRVLNAPPTGSPVDDGARYDTGTMYESIDRSKTLVKPGLDRRYRQQAVARFGFPANPDGTIADAPAAPARPSKNPSRWREDPNYFAMQEYGDTEFDVFYPGMFSQTAGELAFRQDFDKRIEKIRRKYGK